MIADEGLDTFAGGAELRRLAPLSTPGVTSCSPTSRLRRLQRPDRSGQRLNQQIKRIGHAFRSFDNYRLRLLLPCGVTFARSSTNQAPNPRPVTTVSRVAR
jgi:hypothetical protein